MKVVPFSWAVWVVHLYPLSFDLICHYWLTKIILPLCLTREKSVLPLYPVWNCCCIKTILQALTIFLCIILLGKCFVYSSGLTDRVYIYENGDSKAWHKKPGHFKGTLVRTFYIYIKLHFEVAYCKVFRFFRFYWNLLSLERVFHVATLLIGDTGYTADWLYLALSAIKYVFLP